MFYVFENGRILQDPLKPELHEIGLYIQVEVLPEIEPQQGVVSYRYADLSDGLIKIATEPSVPVEIPEDNGRQIVVDEPFLSELEQTTLEIALNTEYLICLAELDM